MEKMAYDAGLAQRVRRIISSADDLVEKEMFGGLAFLLNGNMACGVIGDEVIVRVGKDHYADALEKEGAREFDFSGRPMAGWVTVEARALEEDDDLRQWVEQGASLARSLPAK